MLRIDMHVHSTKSDGSKTPVEIVRMAKRSGVSMVALTDHDTVDGAEEFVSASKRYGVNGVIGIEMSADAPVTTHILGYRLERLDVVRAAMNDVIEKRNIRNREICRKLVDAGIDITMEDVENEAGGRVIARPHFAAVLLKKGKVSNIREAFGRYLAKGGIAYARRETLDAKACIDVIRASGGVAVLAHPSLTGLTGKDLDDLLDELKSFGLWGLECMSSHCTSEEAADFIAAAMRHGLYTTAGSDYHGDKRPWVSLGVQVDDDYLPWGRLGVKL